VKQLGDIIKKMTSSGQIFQGDNYRNRNRTKKSNHDQVFDFLSLIKAWPEIIGERFSKFTTPLKNHRKSLTILTNHPTIAGQLKYMESQIIQNITKKFPALRGQIKAINFQTNSQFFDEKKEILDQKVNKKNKAIHKFSPEYQRELKIAQEIFSDVVDEENKSLLISIEIQSKL
jgi:hypothetical protein